MKPPMNIELSSKDANDGRLHCALCLSVPFNAVQLLSDTAPDDCGHHGCASCVWAAFNQHKANVCPVCRAQNVVACSAPVMRREVRQLRCECECGWKGSVANYMDEHQCEKKRLDENDKSDQKKHSAAVDDDDDGDGIAVVQR